MNTKIISDKANAVIDNYLHFRVENSPAAATCAVPYYNNSRAGVRNGLRALVGKGSPKDIFDEIEIIALRERVGLHTMTGETLKIFMVNHDIGIDCSGFVYYVLNAESLARDKGSVDRHLHFPFRKGILGKIKSKLQPVTNIDVITLAHQKNSRVIALTDVQVGDMITMTNISENDKSNNTSNASARIPNHIAVIHQIEYQNFVPTTLHYTHSIAWPSDGVNGHGVRQGVIEIIDPKKSLTEQRWTEAGKMSSGKTGGSFGENENYTFARAKIMTTEIRRLNWF